jgi:hypothetical protein
MTEVPVANGGAESRIRPWGQAAEALHDQRIETVVESLDGDEVHRCTPMGLKRIQRHPVSEFVQGNGQGRGRRALLLVHGVAEGARLGDRPGDVKQHEDGEITTAAQVVQVYGLVRHGACEGFNPGFDRGVDVDVVALRLSMGAIEPDPKPSERPPQGVNIGAP